MLQMRGPLGLVFLTIFLDLVGFGILIPIAPFYAESFGALPSTITRLSATYSVMQFLFAPLMGRLSDRVGRRPVMLASIALNATGFLIFGFSSSLAWLFAARAASGLGSANLGTAQAIVADVSTPETRAKSMGVIGVAFGLGFILGPVLGGVFGRFGLTVPAFVAAGLSALNFVFASWWLPETRWTQATAAAAAPGAATELPRVRYPLFSAALLKNALARVNVPQLLWYYLVGTIGFSLMEQCLALFIEHTWVQRTVGMDGDAHLRDAAWQTAKFLLLVGVTAAIVQGALIGRLVKVLGERRVMQAGIVLTGIGLALLPLAAPNGFAAFMAAGPVIAIGTGMTSPTLSSLLSQSVDATDFGGILGLGQSLSALGRVIGPSIAGALFEQSPTRPFWWASAMTFSCAIVALTMRAGHRADS
ncbi:MAG: MFS transporter [Vicinamibacterales bacterium]